MPQGRLHVVGGNGSTGIASTNSNTVAVFDNNNQAFIQLLYATNNLGGILFGDSGNSGAPGQITYNQSSNAMGIVTNNSTHMTLDSSGNMTISGTLAQNSDVRLKTNIRPLDDALVRLEQIRGVTFNWKDHARDPREQIGVLAQEVEKVYPQAVTKDDAGVESVSYSGLAAPLIEAVKELKAANDNQAAQIKTLTARLDAPEAARH